MFDGKKLKITAKGLAGGLTNTHDGIAFFGTSDKKNVISYLFLTNSLNNIGEIHKRFHSKFGYELFS